MLLADADPAAAAATAAAAAGAQSVAADLLLWLSQYVKLR